MPNRRTELPQGGAEAFLFAVALVVHAALPLATDFLGPGAQRLFEGWADPVPLGGIPVAHMPRWGFVGGTGDCGAGVADVEAALAAAHAHGGRFDDFVEGGAVSAIDDDSGVGDGDRLV